MVPNTEAEVFVSVQGAWDRDDPWGKGSGDRGAGSPNACLGTGGGGAGVSMLGKLRAIVAYAIPEMILFIL